jgi:molecular chaperone GrpE
MSDIPPAVVAGETALGPAQGLTLDAIEGILEEFRSWLEKPPPPHASPPIVDSTEAEPESVDLHTLLSQFIALRHEVNLQTKAVRAQQEQNAETLRRLTQAVESSQGADQRAQEEMVRPLLKTLVDVRDALGLAKREIQRVQQNVLPALENLAGSVETVENGRQTEVHASLWRRWFGLRPGDVSNDANEERRLETQRSVAKLADQARQALESVVVGYTMSLQRIERTMAQRGLEPVPCVGEAFNAELMEVVEVVMDSGRVSGEVVEEVRTGYLWQGRVFRYAQVRVAKS